MQTMHTHGKLYELLLYVYLPPVRTGKTECSGQRVLKE